MQEGVGGGNVQNKQAFSLSGVDYPWQRLRWQEADKRLSSMCEELWRASEECGRESVSLFAYLYIYSCIYLYHCMVLEYSV